MFWIKKGSRKYIFLVAFFVTFSLLLSGVAVAGESLNESGPGSVQEGGHGGDRMGDLRDLLYRFINFALLVIILFVAIRKSGLKDSLSGRIKAIRQRLDDLRKGKEEAETKYQDLENRLRDFQRKKKDIVEQFKEEGLAEKEKIIAAAKERAKQIGEQAELTIQQEVQSARDRLKQEVVDLAVKRARDIIAKEITEKDQDQLVNEFIERVGKNH
jgi:F-type H+-transporting ATPase subunit b